MLRDIKIVIDSVKQFDASCSYGFLSLFYAEEDKIFLFMRSTLCTKVLNS